MAAEAKGLGFDELCVKMLYYALKKEAGSGY